jgi:hypothetical protein
MENINNTDNKKRKDREPQTIKVNVDSIDESVSQKIAIAFSTIIQKIKERHL